jgi:hypothetical protein
MLHPLSGMKHFFVEHDMPKDAMASITSSYNYLSQNAESINYRFKNIKTNDSA